MKFYTVYKTVNKENGKCYIGKHITDNPYDGYLGSGKYLKRAIKKYGIENFSKFVLYIFDNKEDMDNKEKELVNGEYLKEDTYNLKLGGTGGWDYVNENGFAKNSEHGILGALRYKKRLGIDDEFKKEHIQRWQKKVINGWCKSNDPEIVEKRKQIAGNAFKGKHHSEETKSKMSKIHKGKHIGDKNSQYNTCWIYNDKESIKIKKENLDEYLKQGWIIGRKIKF